MIRNVSLRTLFDLLNEKKRFFRLGSAFILMSLLVIFPSITFMKFSFQEPYQKYDTEAILSKGTSTKATVTSIDVISNVTINNDHPVEINYVYEANGNEVNDKFQTLDLEKTADLKEGSSVNIKAYQNESVITDLESFSFPFQFFYFLPVLFLGMGIVFFGIALVPALKKRKLYQNGTITDAHFIGMNMFSPTPLANERMANVDYYYLKNGRKIFGTSTTKDFLPVSILAKEDIIKIFVNPDNEDESCYISKTTAMKNNWNIKFD